MTVQDVRRAALVDLIRDSGMGIEEFAAKCMARSGTTLYRWLQGSRPIPDVVAHWLESDGPRVVATIAMERTNG